MELQEAVADFRARKAAKQAAEAAKASKAQVLKDLPGYLQKQYGLEKSDVEMAVRNAVYGLYSDDPNVPVDFKLDVRERARALEAEEAQRAQERQAQEQYQYMLGIAAREAAPDAFPASADWYDGDHNRYARALERKALSLAAEAQQKGVWVDLTPVGVQRALEADLHSRLTKVEQKRLAKKAAESKAPATVPTVTSTVGATSGGTTPKTKAEIEAASDDLFRQILGIKK